MKPKRERVSRGGGDLASQRASASPFARLLLGEWRKLALTERVVVVAVSGGADSTALLLGLDELLTSERLQLRLLVAHLDHGLRGAESDADAQWVEALARQLGYEFTLGRVDIKCRSKRDSDNLEQAARVARYEFLAQAAQAFGATLILTGHTMNDQAETILLNLLRGGGIDGLTGMRPVRKLKTSVDAADLRLARPLLNWARREQTEDYCQSRRVKFRTDAMNDDQNFARVRARQALIPLLQTFNPRAVEALVQTAGLLREDALSLDEAASLLLNAARISFRGADNGTPPESDELSVKPLITATTGLRRRALRQWISGARGDLRRITFSHIRTLEKLLDGEQGGRVAQLPGGLRVERRGGTIRLLFGQVD